MNPCQIIAQVKSDFIDALSRAENQVRDYQSKLETLNDSFHKVGWYMLVCPSDSSF